MFLKKLDNLSPPITLYFNEENQHSSIVSGILTFIAYVLVFISGIYYSREFINRENPKSYFYNRFIQDAGTFPVNSSSMFNFIQIIDTRTNEEIPFDFSVFRVIGFDDVFYDEYMENPNILEEKHHWIYGFCNNSSDIAGISNLIDFKYYEQSACIRKYYDKNAKQYYNTDEEGFRWPIIEKGCSHPNRTYYGLIIQRCDEAPDLLKSQGIECKSEVEITEYITKVSLKYQMIDQYADMLNYKMPFTKYFSEVTSAITNGMYIINHLNFNPAKIVTHNGIFFENQVSEHSYIMSQNEKHTLDKTSLLRGQNLNGCLIGIYLWMQNNLQYYERNYDKFQDVLSNIGGISSIVVTIAYFINLLINYYIILLDTEDLMINIEENNFIKRMEYKRPTIFKQAIKIRPHKNSASFGEKSFSQQNANQNSSCILYAGKKNNEKNEQKRLNLNIYKKKSSLFSNFNRNNSNAKQESCINNNSKQSNIEVIQKKEEQSDNSKKLLEELYLKLSNEKKKNKIDNNKSIKKQNFTWIKYMSYLICLGRNNKAISYYETFRAKLISEENIIQSYLDIYGLLKLNNIQKKTTLIETENRFNI